MTPKMLWIWKGLEGLTLETVWTSFQKDTEELLLVLTSGVWGWSVRGVRGLLLFECLFLALL